MEDLFAKWASGDLSEEEKEKFRRSEDYDIFKAVLEGTELLNLPSYDADASYAKVQQKIASQPKVISIIPKWVYGVAVAASIALIIGVTLFMDTSTTSYTSDYGEQVSLQLPDTSEVILNANSTLEFDKDNWENERSVDLEGEAFFKVSKGSTFTVHTLNGEVQVLGTQFTVQGNNSTFEVICYEGKVQTKSGRLSKIITKGQAVRAYNNDFEYWEFNESTPSWLRDESSFNNAPLKQVILALENQYNIDIIDSEIDPTIRFTGFFTHKDPETALRTVFEALEIKYQYSDENTIVLQSNN